MAEKSKTSTKSARKPVVKRKPIAKRKAVAKRALPKKATSDLAVSTQETGRTMFLAGLGIYGKVYDQAQEQINSLPKQLEVRRKKADKIYKELVKRGEKLEKDAKSVIQDIELPKLELDSLTDRKKLEQQIKKAKARFAELKKSVRFKSAA
jgi:ATP phosphoribosyltransferase